MALDVRPLTPDRFADLAALFEEGGDPKWCWCAYFRVRGSFFSNATAATHRAVLEAATVEGVDVGRAPGLVAYDGDDAVGWVSVGPRADYERLTFSKVLAPVDDTPVWSIVCFVVGRHSRGKGIANALLEAAIGYARDHGATTLEAYPVDVRPGHGSTTGRFSRARWRCSSAPGSWRWLVANGTRQRQSVRSFGSAL